MSTFLEMTLEPFTEFKKYRSTDHSNGQPLKISEWREISSSLRFKAFQIARLILLHEAFILSRAIDYLNSNQKIIRNPTYANRISQHIFLTLGLPVGAARPHSSHDIF